MSRYLVIDLFIEGNGFSNIDMGIINIRDRCELDLDRFKNKKEFLLFYLKQTKKVKDNINFEMIIKKDISNYMEILNIEILNNRVKMCIKNLYAYELFDKIIINNLSSMELDFEYKNTIKEDSWLEINIESVPSEISMKTLLNRFNSLEERALSLILKKSKLKRSNCEDILEYLRLYEEDLDLKVNIGEIQKYFKDNEIKILKTLEKNKKLLGEAEIDIRTVNVLRDAGATNEEIDKIMKALKDCGK